MTVLFFTYDVPYPTNSGGKTRAYNLIKHGKKNAKIILFSFQREKPSKEAIDALEKIGIEKMYFFPRKKARIVGGLSFFSSESLFKKLYYEKHIAEKLLSVVKDLDVDVVHFESFYTACYMSEALRMNGVKQIFGSENIEYKIYQEYIDHTLPRVIRRIGSSEIRKIKNEEELYYQQADRVLAVTQSEAKYIENVSGKKAISVIPNGIDPDTTIPKEKKTQGKRLLFIGNFSYFPNVDGIRWFVKEVMPLLSQDVSLTVVGKGAEKIKELQDKKITTVAFVPNIYDAYHKANVFISPIRMGGGTNFKVLEAMVAGTPVVALSEKATAIGLKDEKDLLLADDAQVFARRINRLLEDQDLATAIAKNAHAAVVKNFSWQHIGDNMHSVWKELVDEKN